MPQSPRWRVGLVCARMNFLAGVIIGWPWSSISGRFTVFRSLISPITPASRGIAGGRSLPTWNTFLKRSPASSCESACPCRFLSTSDSVFTRTRRNVAMKPVDVRSELVEALRLDLVGPENGSDLEAEILSQRRHVGTSPDSWSRSRRASPSVATGKKGHPHVGKKDRPHVGKKDRPHVHGLEWARVNPGGSPRL